MKIFIMLLTTAFLFTADLCAQMCSVTIIATPLPSGCDSLWVQVVDSPGCASWQYLWTTGDTSSSIICCATAVYEVYVYPVTSGCCGIMSAITTCPAPQAVMNTAYDVSFLYTIDAGRNILELENISENCTADIYDITGKKVKTFLLNAEKNSMDYSSLTNGLYIAVFHRSNISKAIKLMKK